MVFRLRLLLMYWQHIQSQRQAESHLVEGNDKIGDEDLASFILVYPHEGISPLGVDRLVFLRVEILPDVNFLVMVGLT